MKFIWYKNGFFKNIAKAILCFCFVFSAGYLIAQNQDNYKYIITPHDIHSAWNVDILEDNNRYYVLSIAQPDSIYPQTVPIVTVFDEYLNEIERIMLPEGFIGFSPMKFFYEDNFFYIFGGILDNQQKYKPCFAVFDEQFNLVQPFSLYALDDILEYAINDVLITEKKEFILLTVQITEVGSTFLFNGRIFQINNQGDVLQDVLFPYFFFSKAL